jgi:hypothetical protein
MVIRGRRLAAARLAASITWSAASLGPRVHAAAHPTEVGTVLSVVPYDATPWNDSARLASFRNELEGWRVPPGSDTLVYRYHVVSLWRLDARRMRAQLGLVGAPFCAAMRGADEAFVRELADEVQADRGLAKHDRQSTMQLLYVVSAAILGSDTARRIFHVESIIQDPNVQELISEWEDKGHAKGRAEEARLLLHKVLAARSFPVTPDVRARIDREPDVARLESWLEAAVTAGAIGDVFRDG